MNIEFLDTWTLWPWYAASLHARIHYFPIGSLSDILDMGSKVGRPSGIQPSCTSTQSYTVTTTPPRLHGFNIVVPSVWFIFWNRSVLRDLLRDLVI